MATSNEDICKLLLASLPTDFYGSIELNFHKGILMWASTTSTQKFNPERATAGEQRNGQSWRK
jgi:hypothetical protein